MSSSGTMQISTVSALLGIPVPTIRSWERRYGFPAPSRTRGLHRRYSREEVELLRALRDEITRGHPAAEAVRIVASNAAGGDRPRTRHLDDVLAAAMRLDPTALRRALDDATGSLGVDAAIGDVALPAMHEIGSRWTAGTCDVAQEHLATDVVRTWLARLSAMMPPPHRGATLVLACGPKDLHSIGLEAFGVFLARGGWDVRVLGALTPAEAIVSAVAATEAIGVVITSQRSVTRRAAAEAIAVVDELPGVTVFYAGDAFASASARRDIPGIYLGTDLPGAVTIVDRELAMPGRERRSA